MSLLQDNYADLSNLTVAQLKELAKQYNISGRHRMKKDDLVLVVGRARQNSGQSMSSMNGNNDGFGDGTNFDTLVTGRRQSTGRGPKYVGQASGANTYGDNYNGDYGMGMRRNSGNFNNFAPMSATSAGINPEELRALVEQYTAGGNYGSGRRGSGNFGESYQGVW
jgi:hypothetical protein